MIEINNNSDKRSDITEAYYAEPANLDFVDYPGNYCQCVGDFERLKFTTASIVETDAENGSPINQELQLIIRGQNRTADDTVLDICGKYLIIKLIFSNGDIKIVGVPDNPVVLTSLKSEKPLAITLGSIRNSAEKAKYLLS